MPARAVELQFLPAALELEQTPPVPAARWLARALIALLVAVVTWACIAEVDTVAIADGRVVPAGRVKVVQAEAGGSIRAIHVAEGDAVVAGALLIELDDTAARADLARLQAEAARSAREQARARALLVRLGADGVGATSAPLPVALAEQVEREYAAFSAERAALVAEAARQRAERVALEAEIARLDATLPLTSERAAALAELQTRALAPRAAWLELEESRVARVRERGILEARLAVIAAAITASARRHDALVAATAARWLAAASAAGSELERCAQEVAKAAAAVARHRLRAPVAGVVQELAVHTVGGVVAPAATLMVLVPVRAAPEVEAWLRNRDVGFVAPGQAAVVKIETYPFTRYGTLAGRVRGVSADAVAQDDGTLRYRAAIALGAPALSFAGRRLPVTPGMAVRVEVDLGRRRVVEFLLAPLLRHRDEAFSER
ncbi:MAG: HlyD family type I secretion periplasmic adaptor subunit [Gammaproteobacteria bacterium]|nr:HlyD family type I secretion periplasmic adaptor subunit [Gammaproteobacteria bacterium]